MTVLLTAKVPLNAMVLENLSEEMDKVHDGLEVVLLAVKETVY